MIFVASPGCRLPSLLVTPSNSITIGRGMRRPVYVITCGLLETNQSGSCPLPGPGSAERETYECRAKAAAQLGVKNDASDERRLLM